MNMQNFILAGLAITIVVLLAAYAIYLLRQLAQQQRQRAASLKAQTEGQQEAARLARENISLMLKVIVQEQVSLTEGAIRIMAYQRSLPEDERDAALFHPFDQLARATAYIPILDRWQALSKDQQLQFDLERCQLEDEHRQAIMEVSNKALLAAR
jgi:hypothetical protein